MSGMGVEDRPRESPLALSGGATTAVKSSGKISSGEGGSGNGGLTGRFAGQPATTSTMNLYCMIDGKLERDRQTKLWLRIRLVRELRG